MTETTQHVRETELDHGVAEPRRPRIGGPIGALLTLFSSIWLGVTLMTILFIYCSVGSAIPMVRQARPFEMTEYEWFNWWPFVTLNMLICLNITVATFRRIPFEPLRYGAWTIHAGLIMLAAGSVWYFSTKLEGDVAVARRVVVLSVPGADPVTLAVKPGNSAIVGNDEKQYSIQIANIDPQWSIITGEAAGEIDYAVTLIVDDGTQQFRRQLLAHHPEFTEDVVRTDDPAQPFKRAVKVFGTPLVDDVLQASLEYRAEEHFYLVKSSAIYIREVGSTEWIERPISGLPRYHEYVSSFDSTWPAGVYEIPAVDPLTISVGPHHDNDPLPDVTFTVTDFLPFAVEETRTTGGGGDDPIDPRAEFDLFIEGSERRETHEVVAFDPAQRSLRVGNQEQFRFVWIENEDELQALTETSEPMLNLRIPAADIDTSFPIRQTLRSDPATPFINIGDSGYSYQIKSLENDLTFGPNDVRSFATVIFRGPDDFEVERIVGQSHDQSRDIVATGEGGGHEMAPVTSEDLIATYSPGNFPPRILLIAGPAEDQLRVAIQEEMAEPEAVPVVLNEPFRIAGDAFMVVKKFAARSKRITKPAVVPKQRRQRGFDEQFSMVRVQIPEATEQSNHPWLFYHLYAFENASKSLRRFPYRPSLFTLEDGREFEIMFSRERRPLPARVALDDFKLTSHVGGFTGTTSSIRDWTSVVRFDDQSDGSSAWTDEMLVSVNKPAEFGDFWFFQSQWDPPENPRFEGDSGSAGLNYTVLGVGNRHGVNVMLVGCCISVIGMIYAFYFKPMIKRRRQRAVYDRLAAEKAQAAQPGNESPAGVAALSTEEVE